MGDRFRCTSYPACTKSSIAAMRSGIELVQMSSSFASRSGMSENRMRVRRVDERRRHRHRDDQPIRPPTDANGSSITVEGLQGIDGELHPLQEALVACGLQRSGFRRAPWLGCVATAAALPWCV
jgi:hypothetical protein